MRYILCILLLLPSFLLAQSDPRDTSCYTVTQKDTLYKSTCGSMERIAEFPGGNDSLLKFVKKNVHYPSYSRNLGVTGKVFVKFIVEKDGEVSNIVILKPVFPPEGKSKKKQEQYDKAARLINEEAIRVISTFPKWTPAIQLGKPVRMIFILPLNFKLG
jgi:protein TonB